MASQDRDGLVGAGRALLIVLGVAPSGPVLAYSGVADVTLSWGVGGTSISWSSSASNTLVAVDNSLQFTTSTGSNATSYFNADFATASDYGSDTTDDDCLTLLPGYSTIQLRKYGSRQSSLSGNDPVFNPSPAADAGPAAAAVGTLFFTDTTLTGTLTVVATTSSPRAATSPRSATVPAASTSGRWIRSPSAMSGTASARARR